MYDPQNLVLDGGQNGSRGELMTELIEKEGKEIERNRSNHERKLKKSLKLQPGLVWFQ